MFLVVVIGSAVLGLVVLVCLAVTAVAMKCEGKGKRLLNIPGMARARYARWVMGLFVRDEDECSSCPHPYMHASSERS
ncbi:hypothetical protein [Nonomuraea sediminis]|uniref:hypothetical protein n=1 Tax=Nonomuraea sediminis TaxID=2835864 RepID=UPI001BDCEBAD|nr:hypothetical protein [Nonomuraea sediminis]